MKTRTLRITSLLGAAALLLPACGDPDGGGDGDDATTGVDTTGSSGASAGGDYDVPPPPPLPPGACEPGSFEPCACDGGGAGERVCLPDGEFSACGCAGDTSVYDEPPPPEYQYCGDVACEPYPFPASDYSAGHCCTPEGACGSTNTNMLAGGVCIERGGDPGERSPDCPDESIAFVDFLGCCMPSGRCGMTLDETMPNWDVGCIDRTAWKPLLDGLTTRWFAAIACTPTPP